MTINDIIMAIIINGIIILGSDKCELCAGISFGKKKRTA